MESYKKIINLGDQEITLETGKVARQATGAVLATCGITQVLATGVVDEDAEGITVRGGKMLGTGSIMANEVLFANIQPLKPGEEKYAISFAIPNGKFSLSDTWWV